MCVCYQENVFIIYYKNEVASFFQEFKTGFIVTIGIFTVCLGMQAMTLLKNNVHPYSNAIGKIVVRLMKLSGRVFSDEKYDMIQNDTVDMAEKMRTCLDLDNSSVVASVYFLQFILLNCPKVHWKLAFATAFSLGTKFTTEGFFAEDIVIYVSDKFTVRQISTLEGKVVSDMQLNFSSSVWATFRNALLLVTMEGVKARSNLDNMLSCVPIRCNTHGQDGLPKFCAIVVDDNPLVQEAHRALLLQFVPSDPEVEIICCSTLEDAFDAFLTHEFVHLILIDYDLNDDRSGLDYAGLIKKHYRKNADIVMLQHFEPLCALVTQKSDCVSVNQDGSCGSCNVLIPKPLTHKEAVVLFEASCV